MSIDRRSFIAAAGLTAAAGLPSRVAAARELSTSSGADAADVLRPPDAVDARSASGAMVRLVQRSGTWTDAGVALHAAVDQSDGRRRLPVAVESSRTDLSYVRLHWRWPVGEDARILSDAWERAYGDQRWQGLVPERVLPWFFYLRHAGGITCFGVETQPNAFCFWQCDADGVSLWLDLRNGGQPADLSGRRLAACTVAIMEAPAEPALDRQLRAFCARLSPSPRLPAGAIVGSNDWNYAYGKNSAEGILRDARLMVDLAPAGYRPFVVIDDGWQDPKRFPDLAGLAAQIRGAGARPGIWIRPVRAAAASKATRLPDKRFGARTQELVPAYDPSVPDGLEAAVQSVRDARRQGYEFIKHDFSSYDLLGQWGRDMGPQPALPDWQFADRTRTTAEIVLDFYRALRKEAGGDCLLLGCNTFGHLGAGIFESQRIGDDTSGREWERTRRYGVNSLAFRMAQHRTFFHADPDIVAVTTTIPWALTRQWLDLVARSGTSLFIAPQPAAITTETRAAIRAAMAIAVRGPSGFAVDSMSTTTPRNWVFTDGARQYDWSGQNGADPFA